MYRNDFFLFWKKKKQKLIVHPMRRSFRCIANWQCNEFNYESDLLVDTKRTIKQEKKHTIIRENNNRYINTECIIAKQKNKNCISSRSTAEISIAYEIDWFVRFRSVFQISKFRRFAICDSRFAIRDPRYMEKFKTNELVFNYRFQKWKLIFKSHTTHIHTISAAV